MGLHRKRDGVYVVTQRRYLPHMERTPMRSDADTAVKLILRHEGGKVDNKNDPGGRTNRGVTQRVFTAWLKGQGKSSRDVWTITEAEAISIYKAQYLAPVRYDDLPPGSAMPWPTSP
uniref:DUF847 n=1 Tax=uncultured Leptothrix sp. TaxID=248082 RepID=A0A060BPS8_9BURK|nr:DUF847 [uncultured Leptothrix sp.]